MKRERGRRVPTKRFFIICVWFPAQGTNHCTNPINGAAGETNSELVYVFGAGEGEQLSGDSMSSQRSNRISRDQ